MNKTTYYVQDSFVISIRKENSAFYIDFCTDSNFETLTVENIKVKNEDLLDKCFDNLKYEEFVEIVFTEFEDGTKILEAINEVY